MLYESDYAGTMTLTVEDRNVELLNCFVESTELSISVTKVDPESIGLTKSSFQPDLKIALSTSDFHVAACEPDIAFAQSQAFGTGNILFTQGDLMRSASTILLSFAPSYGVSAILDIATPRNGLVFLTDKGIFQTNGKNPLAAPETGIPAEVTFTHLRSISYCDKSKIVESPMNNVVVAWNQNPSSSSSVPIYISWTAGRTFRSFNVDISGRGGAAATGLGYIRDISIQQVHTRLVLLIKDLAGMDRIVFISLRDGSVSNGYVFDKTSGYEALLIPDGVQPTLVSVASGGGDMFAMAKDLFYSPNGGTSFLPMTLQSRDPMRPAPGLTSDEFVEQFISTEYDDMMVMTSKNRVFYSRTGLPTMMEIGAGIPVGAASKLYRDGFGHFLVYSPQIVNGTISVKGRYLPIQNELASPRAPLSSNELYVCPYQNFETDLRNEYILDVGETVNFTVTVLPSFGFSNRISITHSNITLVNVTQNITESAPKGTTAGLIVRERTVVNRVASVNYTLKGIDAITVRPHSSNLGCSELQKVSTVRLECPPGRRIVLRGVQQSGGNSTAACENAPKTVTIPAGSWLSNRLTNERGSSEKVIPYNCTKYGQPLAIYYSDFWVPTFDLYQDDRLISSVQADMVLWEENGRSTFSYNMTMDQVCDYTARGDAKRNLKT
ncbi:hypothetical protein HK102_012230 [Quaeritorhiza haematococci]|nr:hypothetical protein HK102_012230 [Quaeritorhiza haematococci]